MGSFREIRGVCSDVLQILAAGEEGQDTYPFDDRDLIYRASSPALQPIYLPFTRSIVGVSKPVDGRQTIYSMTLEESGKSEVLEHVHP